MGAVEDFEQRGGLRGIQGAKRLAAALNLFGQRGQTRLQPLAVQGSDDAQTDGPRDQGPENLEQEEAEGGGVVELELPGDGAEDGRQVAGQFLRQHTGTQGPQGGQGKRPLGSQQHRLSLRAAGPIGDVIGEEGLTETVDLPEAAWFVKGLGHKGQSGLPGLVQAGLDE